MPAAEFTELWDTTDYQLMDIKLCPTRTPVSPPHPQHPSELPGDANTLRGEEGEEDVQVTAVKTWRTEGSCLKSVFAS